MAKVTITATQPFQLGANFSDPQLKEGKNHLEMEDYLKVKDQWFFKALIDGGLISIVLPREIPPAQITEITFVGNESENGLQGMTDEKTDEGSGKKEIVESSASLEGKQADSIDPVTVNIEPAAKPAGKIKLKKA